MSTETPNEDISQAAPMGVDAAAAMLAKTMTPEPARERAPNGQFAKAEIVTPQTEVEEKPEAKVVDIKTGKEPAKAEAEDDDPEFELPAEKEGDEPKRFKLSQLYDAFEEAPKLKTELEELRAKTAALPVEYTTAIQEAVSQRQTYLQGLETVARILNPQMPDSRLVNPNSEYYDPEAYYRAMQNFESQKQQMAALSQEIQKERKLQDEQQSVLQRAALAREMQEIKKSWPDLVKPETQEKMTKSMMEDYGFSKEEISAIADHRVLNVIRDALELRALKAKQAEAVKVVRQKPKLVKGAARSTTDAAGQSRASAMQRLQASGSMDAAAEALKGLI